jgi:hypothetical protein
MFIVGMSYRIVQDIFVVESDCGGLDRGFGVSVCRFMRYRRKLFDAVRGSVDDHGVFVPGCIVGCRVGAILHTTGASGLLTKSDTEEAWVRRTCDGWWCELFVLWGLHRERELL